MIEEIKGKRILILGAGTWQVPWIQKASEMGLMVFATDWSDDAEGKEFAHVFKKIDLKNKEESLAFARENQVDAVFTSADIGVQTAAFVAEKLGLPYHNQEVAKWCTNKNEMRNRAKEIGLPIPDFQLVLDEKTALQAATKIGYPVIVKPVDSASSRGVAMVKTESELKEFFSVSQSASFTGQVLIEEFMVGTEGSVEALVKRGIPFIMGICDKIKSELPYRYDLQLNYPGKYSEEQFTAIEKFITHLVNGFKIENGIIHVEIMVTGNEIRLIEFAIRGCGSKVTTHLMPALNGFDLMTWLIASAFGLLLPIEFTKKDFGILQFIMLQKGEIKKISGIKEIKEMPGILDCDIERKVGNIIGVIEDGRSRPGYLLANASNKMELENTVKKALDCLEIIIE